MAFSSSIRHAQDIRFCELCEENSVKWRCVDCDMSYCEKCKIFHLKVPATACHEIVTIGTPIEYTQKKIFTNNLPCSDHPKKMSCVFCKSCDSLICSDCVSFSHKNHNFVPIELALEEKLDYVRKTQDQIAENLKCCDSKNSEVQDMKTKCNAIFDESLTNIKQKEQELIDAIKKQSKVLQDEVEINRRQINRILAKIEQDVNNAKKNLEKQRDETDVILTSNQGKIIFGTTLKIEDLKFDSLPNQLEQFIPDKDSIKKIPALFGYLQKLSIPSPEIRLEVIRTFTTDLSFVNKVVTLDKESAWISCLQREILRKIQVIDNNMKTLQEHSLNIEDMALTLNGDILIIKNNDSKVKLLKHSGEIVSFMTVSPLFPTGIHVTRDNDVLMSVTEHGNLFTPTDQSQGAIIVYGMDGKQKQKYQYDKDGKRLFTFPKRLTTNNNQDILAIDRKVDFTGRVVALNKKGELRWLYEGRGKFNALTKFDPTDIVTTEAGLTIVSDFRICALQVLSMNGEVLTCKVVTEIGIMYPWGLGIDNEEKLWLGCCTGDQNTGAKLHIMKLTNKKISY